MEVVTGTPEASQPFTRHQPFGLAFLRVCSSLDSLDDPVEGPSVPVSSGLHKWEPTAGCPRQDVSDRSPLPQGFARAASYPESISGVSLIGTFRDRGDVSGPGCSSEAELPRCRWPLELLRGSQAPRRAVCGTRGSLRTSHCGGFSCRGAQAPGLRAPVAAARQL